MPAAASWIKNAGVVGTANKAARGSRRSAGPQKASRWMRWASAEYLRRVGISSCNTTRDQCEPMQL